MHTINNEQGNNRFAAPH